MSKKASTLKFLTNPTLFISLSVQGTPKPAYLSTLRGSPGRPRPSVKNERCQAHVHRIRTGSAEFFTIKKRICGRRHLLFGSRASW